MLDKHHPIWGATDLTAGDRLAAVVIGVFAEPNGWCWEDQTTLASAIQQTERNLRRNIQRLVEKGWLQRTIDPRDKRQIGYFLSGTIGEMNTDTGHLAQITGQPVSSIGEITGHRRPVLRRK